MASYEILPGFFIKKAPPWSKRPYAMGRQAWRRGEIPPHLVPYLLKKGDVKPIVEECRRERKRGADLVRCIYTRVGMERRKGYKATTPTGVVEV